MADKNVIWGRAVAALTGLAVSAAGVVAISRHEGVGFVAYPDPGTRGAPWTICYGHTGPEVKPGMSATQSQCNQWLSEDIKKAEATVLRSVKVPIQQGELDAYASFVFNVGAVNWRSSTLLRLLNLGRRKEACDQLPRWKYANRIKLEGLITRRYAERALCLSGGPYVNKTDS